MSQYETNKDTAQLNTTYAATYSARGCMGVTLFTEKAQFRKKDVFPLLKK